MATPTNSNGTNGAKLAPKVEKDDDDDLPITQIKAKPSITKPTPITKPTSTTNKADRIEKTTDTKSETVKTKDATKSINTTTTTTTTNTPSASSKVTVTNTQTTTTPKSKGGDSDDDKPLSSFNSEKKVTVVKKENKGDSVVTKEKTTTVKKEVKKEEPKKVVKKEVKKETPAKKKRRVESDSESSEDEKPKKKKKAVESDSESSEDDKKKKKPTPKKSATKKEKEEDEAPKKRGKKGKEEEEGQWEWWKEDNLPDGKRWLTLVHNGVMFAEPYVPHGVKFVYDGKAVNLSHAAEEVATFYAKYLETDHVKKDAFNKNFWSDFRTYLTADQKKDIKSFDKADFSRIHKFLVEQKEEKAARTTEQKKADKEEKAQWQEKYGFCVINGHKQRIANWAIERPGLFLGRGEHPKTGLVKKRIEAEDITINIGEGVPIPPAPPGHKWAKVVHDDKVAWLAMWKENINNGFKYVWLHASSATKGRSDVKKFEVARKLKSHIDKIRKKYYKELESDELEVRQRSTALYLIDRLALRVGNEKDDDTADTVGCCSLRVEHISLKEPTSVTLDFLGKDSMRYLNTVEVDKRVFKNLNEFTLKPGSKKQQKKPESDLFDQLTTTSLNKYLKEFMPNLSAKVFRTYNASLTLEKELAKMPAELSKATNDEKVLFYNRCNREVAILCNHQRTLSKTHGASMGKIDEKIAEFEKKKNKLRQQILYLKGKGKKPEESESEDEPTPKKATPKKAAASPKKAAASTPTKKRKKGDESEDEEENDFQETPTKKVKRGLPDNIDKCQNAITKVDASIIKWNVKKTEKDELKSVALTTSKLNYIDPRITAAWAKKVGLPMEKLFSKSLRDKFPWAMDVDGNWSF